MYNFSVRHLDPFARNNHVKIHEAPSLEEWGLGTYAFYGGWALAHGPHFSKNLYFENFGTLILCTSMLQIFQHFLYYFLYFFSNFFKTNFWYYESLIYLHTRWKAREIEVSFHCFQVTLTTNYHCYRCYSSNSADEYPVEPR